jgi:Leucine-rich repeat (LRR) protein
MKITIDVSEDEVINFLKEVNGSYFDNLIELDFSKSFLKELPDNLPPSLLKLNCADNMLEKLPIKLPSKLKILYCQQNKLRHLPRLPYHLEELICSYNNLFNLPILPVSLKFIDCYRNDLYGFGYVDVNLQLKFYINSHNAIVTFQRMVRNIIWRRNASLKERCRRNVIVYYDIENLKDKDIPRDVLEYLKI